MTLLKKQGFQMSEQRHKYIPIDATLISALRVISEIDFQGEGMNVCLNVVKNCEMMFDLRYLKKGIIVRTMIKTSNPTYAHMIIFTPESMGSGWFRKHVSIILKHQATAVYFYDLNGHVKLENPIKQRYVNMLKNIPLSSKIKISEFMNQIVLE